MQHLTPLNVTLALIVLNFITFVMFGLDKACAKFEQRRIAEADLLFWAALGGSLGAFAGRALFRHKTRKQPFSSRLQMIGFAHFVLVCALLVFFW